VPFTSFLTEWNGAILRRLSAFVFLTFVGPLSYGQPTCRELWRASEFGASWLEKPSITSFLQSVKNADLRSALATVSTDFLLSSALDLEQRVLKTCPDASLSALLERFQKAYLQRLGIAEDVHPWNVVFQGLVTSGEEFNRLQKAIRALPAGYGKKGALPLLRLLFREASLENGVVVLGGTTEQKNRLRIATQKACEGFSVCPLWDPAFLLRVTILPGEAKAEYDPAIGALRVSQDLFGDLSELKQLVFVHELAHAAIWRLQQTSGDDPRERFADFSGWKKDSEKLVTPVRAIEGAWRDVLADASKGSPFGILPDPVMPAQRIDGRFFDGFVFAKSVRETQASGDLSEDMADHIAAYVVAPGRFCYGKKPIAPQKFEWVAKSVFGLKQTLVCDKVL
jgi:hypothetical protein